MSISHKGKKLSKETREKMSKAQKGRKFTKEWREKISKGKKANWANGVYDNVFCSPSGLEIKFAEELDKRKIAHKQQFRIGTYLADFLIDDNLVVELNGDYWHGTEEAKEYDKIRNDWIESQGYKVLVIWESEFHNDPNLCIEKMLKQKEGQLKALF